MSSKTRRATIAGPAGRLECAIDEPPHGPRGVAVVCHPHPLEGGTLDNKVAHTLARAFVQLGMQSVRFNLRGVGESEGAWDDGPGEIDDALAVVATWRDAALPLVLAGFSFGGFVAASAAQRLPESGKAAWLVLVGPATENRVLPAVAADTLVIHGASDDVVPLAATLEWARPQSLPVTVIPGGGHFFHGQLTLLKNIVVRACKLPAALTEAR